MTTIFNRRLIACGLLACANAAHGAHAGWFAPHGNGNFSAVARNVCASASPDGSKFTLVSPDGRRKIVTDHAGQPGATTVLMDDAGRRFPLDLAAWSCPEIAWAPDSHAFFVTYSDGGAVGTYAIAAYRLRDGRLKKMALGDAARADFSLHYPRCETPETPNIAGIAWSVDGSILLVAAQVLNHSNCDDMGTFSLYEVAVPTGKIRARYGRSQQHAAFAGLLGPLLQDAPDTGHNGR